ncbi:MAG TPA: hypothetical protein VK137_16820 [Planctomycetaceae bacterium]|nr:hypothetical protein [Planctomycetaceae bacterium]
MKGTAIRGLVGNTPTRDGDSTRRPAARAAVAVVAHEGTESWCSREMVELSARKRGLQQGQVW